MPFLERFFAISLCAPGLHLRRYALEWLLAFVILVSALASVYLLLGAPRPYPSGEVVVIAEGSSAQAIARQLRSVGLVRYPLMLELLWRVTGTGQSILPGAYRFAEPENLYTTAHRLSTGAYGIPPVRITFQEGTTVFDMTKKVANGLPGISASDFIGEAGPYEGYLFPDTYIFQPSATAASIVIKLQDTFLEKTESLA